MPESSMVNVDWSCREWSWCRNLAAPASSQAPSGTCIGSCQQCQKRWMLDIGWTHRGRFPCWSRRCSWSSSSTCNCCLWSCCEWDCHQQAKAIMIEGMPDRHISYVRSGAQTVIEQNIESTCTLSRTLLPCQLHSKHEIHDAFGHSSSNKHATSPQ